MLHPWLQPCAPLGLKNARPLGDYPGPLAFWSSKKCVRRRERGARVSYEMFTPTANLRPVVLSDIDSVPRRSVILTTVSLCHFSDSFFKDLQTNFPEIFHACSSMYRSCFTLPVFTKNRQKREAPQHVPATSVGTISKGLVSPYVTFGFAALARGIPSRRRG